MRGVRNGPNRPLSGPGEPGSFLPRTLPGFVRAGRRPRRVLCPATGVRAEGAGLVQGPPTWFRIGGWLWGGRRAFGVPGSRLVGRRVRLQRAPHRTWSWAAVTGLV